ncbi:glycosyltransferase family 2 protein [Oscillatoria sp. CS-180]|uniref:2'-O-glycosyltransferase CruG n=1 Tax=Oscillatoria sp. CS-180 TaxID=3021720 RepID=UPI00232E14B9|nr:glycosyltransferase family 2 protein [Oscillatoria sp. CS-180]MDB9528611.1 glycosyltransferase family 2 protein [Oscillatoria sp. CS-180]
MITTDTSSVLSSAVSLILLALQLPAVMVLMSRLLKGPTRRPPLQPQRAQPDQLGTVSVVVPTLNEVARLSPCLDGLSKQTYEVREILVVDSRSQDGTRELVQKAQETDTRLRLLTDDPLPDNWVGRPWALHYGYTHSSDKSRWILGIDADTQPQPGLVPALIAAAEAEGYDLVSLSPRFILKSLGEIWLQPALLMTLVYRFGPTGASESGAERVMANGQCFLCRRELLDQLGGYTVARMSFCDDVTLARQAAQIGAKVGFWDGSAVLKVRMYEGLQETWREWGRSLDLKDASSSSQVCGDLWFLTCVQALPWLGLPFLLMGLTVENPTLPVQLSLGLNASLIAARIALQFAILPSYDLSQAQSRWAFWLSPLADPLAVLRIWLSSVQTPTSWRGRQYDMT